MKVHVIAKMAREYRGQLQGQNVLGEIVAFTILKVFQDKDKLQQFMKENTFLQLENINGLECFIEIGVIEDVDLE